MMSPEQEQRLGQMMFAEARSAGHISKLPPDTLRNKTAIQAKIDAETKDLIWRHLSQAQEPISRQQIIRHISAGSGTIDRCLKRLSDEGKVRRIQTRTTTHWEIIR
jgi:predicted HTH transcriptional regulator